MLNDLEDLIGDAPTGAARRKRTRTKRNRRRSLGKLHDALSKALPDMCDSNGVCDLHALAKELGLSYMAVWKWMRPDRPNRLPARHAGTIADLSKEQKRGGTGFVPATKADFLSFIC